MTSLFKEYILTFGFDEVFVLSKFKSLGKEFDYKNFVKLRKWYFDDSNHDQIIAIKKEYALIIEANNQKDSIAFNEYRDSLVLRVPSLENMSTYIGMFDET